MVEYAGFFKKFLRFIKKMRHKIAKLKNYIKGSSSLTGHARAAVSFILALIICVVFASASLFIYGADSDDIEEEIDEAQEEAEEIEDEIDSLNDQLEEISDSIEELSSQMAEVEEEIEALQEEIEAAQENIDRLEENREEQYESLSAWIQVSYENEFDSMILSLLSADSFAEVINQAEYVQSLSDFGFDLIERYSEIVLELETEKEDFEARSAALEEDIAALDELKTQTIEKKAEISELIAQAQENLENKNEEIDSLEEELAAQLEYEAELEAQREAEEAAHAAELAAIEAANTGEAYVSTDSGDLELLAAIIYCEAGGEIYEGKLAVACVVINRVRSSSYPNTISGVIYQSGQFSPASSGRLATVLANGLTTESCYDAAAYVLAGNLPYPNFLSFCSASVSLSISTTVIGNHQFY